MSRFRGWTKGGAAITDGVRPDSGDAAETATRDLRPELRVFLSYRRSDDRHLAGRLRDFFVNEFGDSNVFFDVDSIPGGADFRVAIRECIASVDVMVVLIGHRWEPSRLTTVTDPVRLELQEALRQNKPVIPVLIDDTPMPTPDELPTEFDQISYLNALGIRPDPDFHSDVTRITRALRHARQTKTTRPVEQPERLNSPPGTMIGHDVVGPTPAASTDVTRPDVLDPTIPNPATAINAAPARLVQLPPAEVEPQTGRLRTRWWLAVMIGALLITATAIVVSIRGSSHNHNASSETTETGPTTITTTTLTEPTTTTTPPSPPSIEPTALPPTTSVVPPKPTQAIPNLAGQTTANATNQLKAAGFTSWVVQNEASTSVQVGMVTRTSPAAGSRVSLTTTVTVYVSKGPDSVLVPSVVGLTQVAATQQLGAKGFVPQVQFVDVDQGNPNVGLVINQTPRANDKVPSGTEVLIEVGRAKAGGTTTSTTNQGGSTTSTTK